MYLFSKLLSVMDVSHILFHISCLRHLLLLQKALTDLISIYIVVTAGKLLSIWEWTEYDKQKLIAQHGSFYTYAASHWRVRRTWVFGRNAINIAIYLSIYLYIMKRDRFSAFWPRSKCINLMKSGYLIWVLYLK